MAPVVFTDDSKTDTGSISYQGKVQTFIFPVASAQHTEILVVIEAFKLFSDTPINIYSDSLYVVQALSNLECAGLIALTSAVSGPLRTLQQLIRDCRDPFFIGHLRAHTAWTLN